MAHAFRKIALGALVIAGLGAAGYELSRPEQIPVDMEKIARGPLEVTVNGDGMTRIRDVYEVSAPVSGKVLRSPVAIGDAVVAGESVVARIEPGAPAFLDERARRQAEAAVTQAEAALALARAQIRSAEADVDNAQRNLNRVYALWEKGNASDAQEQQAEVAVDVATAQLDSAHATEEMRQSQLDAARAVLIGPANSGSADADAADCCIQLKAPVSGEVLSVTNESERMVAAGTALATIGRLNDLEIAIDLLSTDAVRIAPGAKAYVERWGGPATLEAKVRTIEPAAFTKVSALGIEEQRVKVLLDFVTPADKRPGLGHNFRVYLRIVEWHGDNVLRAPISALFRQDGDWALFVVDGDNIAHVRRVTIGHRNTDYAEVTDGLSAGETVVTHPSDRVAEGVLVTDRTALQQ
jgi:HlyD family secretion protein